MVDETNHQRRTFVRGVGAAIGGAALGSQSVAAVGPSNTTNGTANQSDGSEADGGQSDGSADGSPRLRTCSFNVRHDDADDHPWSERRSRVVDTITDVRPDLLAVQEAQPSQFEDLVSGVEGYQWHGVGRSGGKQQSQMSPVAWRTDRFQTVETGAFWLSETPGKPSVGWTGDTPRVATWASLRHGATGRRLWFCNVHVSHVNLNVQNESARLLRNRARSRAGDEDVVLAGDLNFEPHRKPYQILTGTAGSGESPLFDARREVDTDSVRGPWGTYHGFTDNVQERLDYVFPERTASVDRYRTLPIPDDGFRSDHLPVVTEFTFQSETNDSN
jgi:endonuclease/exonuclease/phosphatase family metal-dependent hydrolase